MPSKGSERVILRVAEPWYSRMMATIERNNQYQRDELWTISSWILDAIKDKLCHQERARVQKERRRQARAGKLERIAVLHGSQNSLP